MYLSAGCSKANKCATMVGVCFLITSLNIMYMLLVFLFNAYNFYVNIFDDNMC